MKLHDFQEFADQVMEDPERKANVERHRREAIAGIVEYTLAELRKHPHMTQAELAEALGIRQASVSRVEHANPTDVQLATLRSYIEAMGGTLEIAAVIEGERFPIEVGITQYPGREAGR
jgi:transcriptional regulator with XRE-family HTH domain